MKGILANIVLNKNKLTYQWINLFFSCEKKIQSILYLPKVPSFNTCLLFNAKEVGIFEG